MMYDPNDERTPRRMYDDFVDGIMVLGILSFAIAVIWGIRLAAQWAMKWAGVTWPWW